MTMKASASLSLTLWYWSGFPPPPPPHLATYFCTILGHQRWNNVV